MKLRSLTTVVLLGLLLSACGETAQRPPVPKCKDPQDTVMSVLRWQRGKFQDLSYASECFDQGSRSKQDLKDSARRLKKVFEQKATAVVESDVPHQADYVDPQSKEPRWYPDRAELPEVYVVKKGDQWRWSLHSQQWADDYYAEHVAATDQLISRIPPQLKGKILRIAYWQYLALILLLALGLLVRKLLQAVVAARVRQLTDKLGHKWTTSFIDVIASPGATLVTAIILRIGYPELQLDVAVGQVLAIAVRVLITISIVWAIYRGVDLLSAQLLHKAAKTESKLDDQLVPLLRKSLKVIVFVIGVLVVLQNINVDVTTMLAGLSLGGLAFGLAAKDTLANFFGSISIFLDSPFQIGDWINVGGTDGEVEEVGFRSTRVRTFYNSVVIWPNAKLADSKIDNYGQRRYRRTFVTLGLTYDTTPEQIQAFVEGIRAIIQANRYTWKDKYEVHFAGFGDSSLNVMVYFFFKADTWTIELRERHNVFLAIMHLARDLGVSFAFPTSTLHVESLAHAGERLSPPAPEVEQLRALVQAYGPGGERALPDGHVLTEHQFVPGVQKQLAQPAAADAAGEEAVPEAPGSKPKAKRKPKTKTKTKPRSRS